MKEKRREACVLFLDDGFGAKEAPQKLIAAGFRVVSFEEVFQTRDGKKREKVKDPEVIRHCSKKRRVLFTTDKKILFAWADVIVHTDIAIIATESNVSDPSVWIGAIIKAKAKIERFARKFPRPSFACLSRSGELHRKTHVTVEWINRSSQNGQGAKEGQEPQLVSVKV